MFSGVNWEMCIYIKGQWINELINKLSLISHLKVLDHFRLIETKMIMNFLFAKIGA